MPPPAKVREVGTDGIAFETNTPASQPGDVFPSGVIMQYAGSSAPTNWLIADGSVVSRSTYANLFAAIGTTYGAGDGSTTFGLPDLRDKVAVGKSGTKALGSTGGAATVALITSQLPAHNHPVSDPGHNHSVNAASDLYATPGDGGGSTAKTWGTAGGVVHGTAYTPGINVATTGVSVGNTGSGSAHENMPPYVALNYIIKT